MQQDFQTKQKGYSHLKLWLLCFRKAFLSWKYNLIQSDQNKYMFYIVYTHLQYLKHNYIYIKEGTLQNVSIIFNRSQWFVNLSFTMGTFLWDLLFFL